MADLALATLGLIILLLGGDLLVRGAVNVALRLGIPALIVSLTIVSFGTSAPELLIAIRAVADGASGIAMGNVVGSNTANVLLVLGIPALMAGLDTQHCETRKSYVVMLAATALFIALCFYGPLEAWHGVVLLGALAVILFDQSRDAIAHRKAGEQEEVEGADDSMPWWKILGFVALGLVALPLGADILVDSATDIARDFNVSEALIGLTLVAIGTSLPELATTVAAAMRRQADVALGNVIGSNIFNLLAIIGVASFVDEIDIAETFLRLDFWVMLAASLLLAPIVFFKRRMTRIWGGGLTLLYVIYLCAMFAVQS